jgi:uncharacterized protein YqgV (UPF0045/DUF77 family)
MGSGWAGRNWIGHRHSLAGRGTFCTVNTTRLKLAFTVEPFVDGRPGPHVFASISAVEATGLTVEMGPFDNLADGGVDEIAAAVSALVRAAFTEGATRLSLQVSSE